MYVVFSLTLYSLHLSIIIFSYIHCIFLLHWLSISFYPSQVNFIVLGWAANVMAYIKSSINSTFFVVRYDVSKDNHYRRHISFSKSKATSAIMRTDFPFPHLCTHSHTYLLTHILSYIIIYALTCEHGYVMNEANWNSLRLLEIHRKLREKEKNGMSGMLPTRSFQSDSGWQYFLKILIRFHYLFRLQPNQFSILVVNIKFFNHPCLLMYSCISMDF